LLQGFAANSPSGAAPRQVQRAEGQQMKLQRVMRFLTLGLLLLIIPAALSSPSSAQFALGVSVRVGPPPLPIYAQPLCPGPGYIWTPGYWAWSDDDGYYWVPGTWVLAPEVGFLWTPGYWGWVNGFYVWNAGYWGPHIGFYGGINYGFGYFGEGFAGGEWRGGRFFYNRSVTNVNVTNITNVYNKTVIVNNNTHVAFNGGKGGTTARPTPQQAAWAHESHRGPVAAQLQHQQAASHNRALLARENHGRPPIAATARPASFTGRGVVSARAAGGAYHTPAMSPKQARVSNSAGNRVSGNHPAGNQGANRPSGNRSAGSNKADRPANSSNRSNTSSISNRPLNNNRTSNRTSSNRPSDNRSAKASPPPSSHASNPPRRESTPRAQTARPSGQSRPQSGQATRPSDEAHSRPAPQVRQSAPRPAPQARQIAPRPAPQPRQNAAKPAPNSARAHNEPPRKSEQKQR
jgi:hypothetical protein